MNSGASRPESRAAAELEARLWPRALHVQPLRLRHAPLLAAAASFAFGESLSLLPPRQPHLVALLALAAAALLCLALLALRRAPRIAPVAACALWIAVGLWSVQLEPASPRQTALTQYADGLSRTVEARVIRVRELPPRTPAISGNADSDPDQWDEPGTPALSVDLALTAIEQVTPDVSRMVPISGGVRVTLYRPRLRRTDPATANDSSAPPLPRLRCNDQIALPLRLRMPERYRDPGAWQYADYLLDQGIAATASAPTDRLEMTRVDTDRRIGWRSLRCRAFAAQTWAAARLPAYVHSAANRHLPAALRLTPGDAGMLNAMLFGDRTRLTQALRLGFERTGSFHLFVVSGMHVALLAGIIFFLARRLRLGELYATLATIALSSGYALLTGLGMPVQRALLMTSVFLLARLLSRDRNVLNSLGAAALAVLVWTPHALFEASFQMTFLAILSIAGIAVPLGERSFLPYARAARRLNDRWRDAAMPPRLAQLRVMLRLWGQGFAAVLGPWSKTLPALILRWTLWAAELALVGLVAEAVMALPMAAYFHRATLFALPANIISVPLVAVLAPLALITFLCSLAGPWLATLPGTLLALLLHATTGAIRRLSQVQAADLRVPGPSAVHAVVALGILAFCCWAVRRSRPWMLAATVALPIVTLAALWPSPPRLLTGQLEVTAIDVGQGDSLFIAGPGGRTMLVDAGGPTGAAANAENAAGSSTFDIGEEIVSPYLWSRQIRRLDVVVLTHAHSDHMGGMPAVLRNFRPRELWVAVDPDSERYRELLAEARTLGIRVRHLRAGDRIAWDKVAIRVLAPARDYSNPGPPVNDDSLVMHLQYGRASVLLEGDAQAASEDAMAGRARTDGAAAQIGPVTLLKVAHHGSLTSTTPEFLALAAPEDAVISVGRNNTFGHPREEVIDRLAEEHARIYRTDRDGAMSFLLTPAGGISALAPASNP
ncbi:MAG TPA: ComEC/Rec2 family competence protein [Acidobacteriaceae bacterium]|nr:ComEC/Rec2 family competence protein [Acidobacteriaceae bacterium]